MLIKDRYTKKAYYSLQSTDAKVHDSGMGTLS